MTATAMRLCCVSEQAEALVVTFDRLGLNRRPIADCNPSPGEGFRGAIYAIGNGWIEVWPAGEGMPAGIMIQLVVDDADAVAAAAREGGLAPQGPMDAHGERIYLLAAPGGLQLAFQSPLPR
jgi:hypothetical protein